MFWPNGTAIEYGCHNLDDTMDISCSQPADGDDCWKITIPARSKYDGVEIKCSLYENGNNEVVAVNSSNLIIIENTESTPTTKPFTRKPNGLDVNDGHDSSPGEIVGKIIT